jgi:hypothetical protein
MTGMDASQSDVVHDGTGCTLLDNAGAYCPDARSALLRRQHLSECKIKFGSQLRGIPKGGRHQPPFGCRLHRDNKLKSSDY